MKVRLIVRVPKRLLSGRLGSAVESSSADEVSTADTLHSLLSFDAPDSIEEWNGAARATEFELPAAPNDPAKLPEAPELAELLDFDEIEAWSKSTSTLSGASGLFTTEPEPLAAEEAELEIPERPVEAAPPSGPGEIQEEVREEVPDEAQKGGEAPSEGSEQAHLLQVQADSGSAAVVEPEPTVESEQLEVAQREVAEEPTAAEEPSPEQAAIVDLSEDDHHAAETKLIEKPAIQDLGEPVGEPADATGEDRAGTVQDLGHRDDVVRNALSSMPWWQRWENLEKSTPGQTLEQEFTAEQESPESKESQPDTWQPEEANAAETRDEGKSPLDETGEPISIDPELAFPAAETAEEEPVSQSQESSTEQLDTPVAFAPAEVPPGAPPLPDTSASETFRPGAGTEERYIPATPGTDDLWQALEHEEASPGDAAPRDPDTIYSWSAFDRPQGKVMVPVSEKVVTTRRRRTIAAISAIVILLLGSAGWLYKAQTDPIRALKSMESGRRRLSVGDYGEAILDLNNAISIDPDNLQIVDAYLLRGRAHVAMGRAEEALPDFTKAIQRAPNNVAAYMDRGLAYFDVGLYNQALNDAGKIIELDNQSADGYALHGMALRETGNLEAAMDDFNRAVELEPNLANRLQRGLLLQKLGRHEEAIEDFNEAIYLNPASPTAYFSRAQSLRELGEEAAATQDHRTARYLDGR